MAVRAVQRMHSACLTLSSLAAVSCTAREHDGWDDGCGRNKMIHPSASDLLLVGMVHVTLEVVHDAMEDMPLRSVFH